MIQRWLSRARPSLFVAYCIAAAFCTYFCMYAFRKPFGAATFEELKFLDTAINLKTAFVISQIIGYTISKYLGCKFCSEIGRRHQAKALVAMILIAQLALLGFAMLPANLKVAAIFINGVPLGMVWGLVSRYLEGRKTAELLFAGLSCSYILASSSVKTVGSWTMESGVEQFWMPATVGAIFLVPFFLSVFLLNQLPPPDEEDVASRNKRSVMDGKGRMAFVKKFLIGLILLLVLYFFLTAYRDFRDNYMPEVFAAMGYPAEPTLFSKADYPIAFGIMITYASYRKRRSNLTSPGLVVAFANSSFEILAGIGVFATLGFLAFRQGVDVSELDGIAGVGLSFVTFPAIVSEMPGGPIFGALFFGSLAMAGFTSLVSVLQVVIAAVQEKLSISRRAAAVGIGVVSAVLSVLFFSTTTGLLALDVTDMWANNVGIVASAVLMTILVIWVLRRGPELRYHLNAVSTFPVGRIWIGLVGVLAPLVLGYMLVARIITLLTEGYDTYPFWYLGIFGWGTVAVLVLGAVIGTLVPWRHSPDDYRAWPPYPPASVDNRKEARR